VSCRRPLLHPAAVIEVKAGGPFSLSSPCVHSAEKQMLSWSPIGGILLVLPLVRQGLVLFLYEFPTGEGFKGGSAFSSHSYDM